MTSRSVSPYLGSSSLFMARNEPGGVYEEIADHAVDDQHCRSYLGSSANSLGRTFDVVEGSARAGGGWTSFDVVKKDGFHTEFKSILVGEMRSVNAGTKIGALGNHYVGPAHSPNGADVAGVVHAASDDVNHIKLVTDQIYKNNKNQAKKKPSASSKVLLTKETVSSLNDRQTEEPVADSASSADGQPLVRLGASYPLECLPDHTGPIFRQVHSTVHQLDVFDLNGDLVPPWLMPSVLKPGVLAFFEGVFNIWIPPGRNPIMQFVAKSVKVIGDSNSEPELPVAPSLPEENCRKSSPGPEPGQKRSAAFESFGSKTKKGRADMRASVDEFPSSSTMDWSVSLSPVPEGSSERGSGSAHPGPGPQTVANASGNTQRGPGTESVKGKGSTKKTTVRGKGKSRALDED
ncbi:hypothetical protein CVT24_011978 [Panaeolus cyanescens]|uniref:Uncharacterized protein n=1 Tax=Panaeolus cyanescens TaxID=181874 RepID=A0A409VYZ2_9AGAR|nr:hypothetical protein CVT24_011978 [Panaeolus cyanescens]